MKILPKIALLLTGTLILAACNPLRKYPAGSYLLVKNRVTMTKNTLDRSSLEGIIKQKPNRKNFGLYFNIRFYNWGSRGKDNGFHKWLRNTLGSEPVILDSMLTETTARQMRYYLENHGYFNSSVTYTIHRKPYGEALFKKLERKRKSCASGDSLACAEIFRLEDKIGKLRLKWDKRRKARVDYNITTTTPYRIRNVGYSISDATLKAFVFPYLADCKIKTGEIYNTDNLDAERTRITNNLQQNGYFYFSKDYISYTVDSNLGNHQLDITLRISDRLIPMPGNPDSLITAKHMRYTLNRILINTDWDPNKAAYTRYDTIRKVIPHRFKNRPAKVYYYIFPGKLKMNFRTLAQAVYVDTGDVFTVRDVERTYKGLLDLRLYRYVNIGFIDLYDTINGMGRLDCQIKLTKSPVSAVSVEAQATNTGGELGVSGNLVFQNKNLFRGAEVFSTTLNLAVEFQQLITKKKENSLDDRNKAIDGIPFLNTIETGISFDLSIPRFLMPIKQEKFPKYFKPKTTINAAFNYQLRPHFSRYYATGSFGYQWKESEYKTHIITPLQLNVVKIFPDSIFLQQIESLQDPMLKNTYSDHIITALSYSFIYNTQELNKTKDFIYFRGDAEIAGLIFWLVSKIQGRPGAYSLLGLPYSQYYRLAGDFRYYLYANPLNILVFRAYAGYGGPLNKNNVLPFEKSFYLGGSNSMRAWRLRALGPGSYEQPDSVVIDKIGDIGMEFNVEYRFPVYKILKGALFVDCGNIWLARSNPLYPGGSFMISHFLSELAFDAGLGIRLDFNYFAIRLDLATTIKDPSRPPGSRWVGQNSAPFQIIGNFGIGYPF